MIYTALLTRFQNATFTGAHLGLASAMPEAGNFHELSGANYARLPLSPALMTIAGGAAENTADLYMNECKDENGWGTATHVFLASAATGGSLLLADALEEPVAIANHYMPKFEPGELSLTLTAAEEEEPT